MQRLWSDGVPVTAHRTSSFYKRTIHQMLTGGSSLAEMSSVVGTLGLSTNNFPKVYPSHGYAWMRSVMAVIYDVRALTFRRTSLSSTRQVPTCPGRLSAGISSGRCNGCVLLSKCDTAFPNMLNAFRRALSAAIGCSVSFIMIKLMNKVCGRWDRIRTCCVSL